MPKTQAEFCMSSSNLEGGVDIFFFISALGLCASFRNNSDFRSFYMRRIKRILPTWVTILVGMHLLNIVLQNDCPHTTGQAFLYYTGLGWWLSGLYDNGAFVYLEWYIPTLLLFYALFPFLYKIKLKYLLGVLIISIIVTFVFSFNGILSSLKLAHQRLPIFIFGILCYKVMPMIESSRETIIEIIFAGIGVSLFACGLLYLPYESVQELFMERIALLLSMPLLLHLLASFLEMTNFDKVISMFGKYSLELYLLHLNLIYIPLYKIFYPFQRFAPLSLILTILLFLLLSVVLNKSIKYTLKICTRDTQ